MAPGLANAQPEQYKICKCPTPGTDKGSKCPAVVRGGGGEGCMGAAGIDWCISVVQILGIFKKKNYKKTM